MTATFILPMEVILPRVKTAGKKIRLNLNVYRNLHHRTEHDVKKAFKPITTQPFKASEIAVYYTIHPATKRKFDTMNIIAIVDKYFLDWLQNEKMIPDDNYQVVHHGAPKVEFHPEKKDCVTAKVFYKKC